MTIEDLRSIDAELRIDTDLCLVGSGPAGWTIAEELRESGLRILILESGGFEREPDSDALNQIESVGVPLFNGRDRVLGGTSDNWGGRCISLDDIDYEARPWVPFSGWPFGSEMIAPYLDRASEHLGVGPYGPDGRGPAPDGISTWPDVDRALLRRLCWQISRKPIRFGRLFLARPNANLRVLVHATVTHLNTGSSGEHLKSIEIADPEGRRAIVRARAVVLCAGGIENARILLYSNRIMPNGVGNSYDVVGRFLMDHPRDPDLIVRLDTRDAARVRAFFNLFGPYKRNGAHGRHSLIYGLSLSPERQRRDGLLNCAAWPFEVFASDDPMDAAKRLVMGPRAHALRDARLIISQPGFLLRAVQARLLSEHVVKRKIDRIGFVATSEQRPDPDSRIRLSERRDRLGLPIAEIDWRISAQERASLAALAQSIAREFQRLDLPPAHPADWVRDGRYDDAAFVDSCHPTGTTRMASNPRYGVVNADSQVHDIEGLYVAGSSVFPTGGHANPTLMIVAFAVRLAHHLRERLSTKLNFRPGANRATSHVPTSEAVKPFGEGAKRSSARRPGASAPC
jgi:choline dehydrogenase-like flavoprotein